MSGLAVSGLAVSGLAMSGVAVSGSAVGDGHGARAALPTLAQQLRTDTRALHTEVERTGVMCLLLRGQLGPLKPGSAGLALVIDGVQP